MIKALFLLNVLLTLPFGAVALFAPASVFSQFGLQLDAAGELVARGYSATLIGFGLLIFLLRHTADAAVAKVLLLSLVVFNTIEAVIQGLAGIQGVAFPLIFANVVLHGVVALACLVTYLRRS